MIASVIWNLSAKGWSIMGQDWTMQTVMRQAEDARRAQMSALELEGVTIVDRILAGLRGEPLP